MNAGPRIQSADRVTLLLALVPYILENDGATVAEIADAFDTNPREIRELINRLRGLGIPGESGVYLPNDLFQLDDQLFDEDDIVSLTHTVGLEHPPRWSGHEAATLIAGLQFVGALLPESQREIVEKLAAKISRGSATPVAAIGIETAPQPAALQLMQEASSLSRQLTFEYPASTGEREVRHVDVLRLDLVGSFWYLRAWCHDRDALRTFRIDRMHNIAISQEPTSSKLTAAAVPLDLFDNAGEQLPVAQLEIAESLLPQLVEYHPQLIGSASKGLVKVEIRFQDPQNVINLVATYPSSIQVLSPESLRTTLLAQIENALRGYDVHGIEPQPRRVN